MGAALYGLTAGQSITWPDLDGHGRRIRIVRVRQPIDEEPPAAA
jgi:transcription elongation GreA/GreB family factor